MADSGLGDILAGAAGAPVNRPALNAYITQGQAMAGLRTAQTQEALQNAQRARDEQDAAANLKGALVNMGMKEPDADVASGIMRAHFGNSQQAFEALKIQQETANRATLSDPNQLGTPAQTAAMQGVQGKIEPFTPVPSAYVTNPGQTTGDVHASPVAGAKMGLEGAQALLARAKAEHPDLFKAGAVSPEQVAQLVEYIQGNPNAAPTGRALMSPTGAAVAAGINTVNGNVGTGAAPIPATPGADGQPKPAAVPGASPQATATPDQSPAVHVPGGLIKPAPGVSLAEQAAIRKDFASGTAAKQTSSLNTMVLHSMLFDKIADQLGNGNFTPTNEINQLWQRVFGGAAPANLQTAGRFLGNEAVRATVNSGAGTGEERELKVDVGASPEQLHGVAATLRSLAGGQLHSLIRRGARGGVDPTQLLDQEAIDAYGLQHNGQSGGTGATGSHTPIPSGTSTGLPSQDDITAELARRGIK